MNLSNFEKAMKAAVEGPEVKKIKFEKHEFNVKPVKITGGRVSGGVVKGHISHHLSWRDDDQVHYEFQLIAGQRVTIEQVKVEVDGSLMNKIIGDIVSSLWDALKAWLTEQGKDKLDFSTQELATKPDDAKERIFQESQGLLDGEWLGEVKFMIVNIAGRLAIQSAQAVYRETHRPTKPPTHEPPKPKLPTPKVPKPDGGPRHEP